MGYLQSPASQRGSAWCWGLGLHSRPDLYQRESHKHASSLVQTRICFLSKSSVIPTTHVGSATWSSLWTGFPLDQTEPANMLKEDTSHIPPCPWDQKEASPKQEPLTSLCCCADTRSLTPTISLCSPVPTGSLHLLAWRHPPKTGAQMQENQRAGVPNCSGCLSAPSAGYYKAFFPPGQWCQQATLAKPAKGWGMEAGTYLPPVSPCTQCLVQQPCGDYPAVVYLQQDHQTQSPKT